MAIVPVKVPWPLAGKSENTGFSDQEPMTTEEYINTRGVDPKTGRVRGAQRPGLTELLTGYADAQGTKIDWMGSVTQGTKVASWAYGVDSNYDMFSSGPEIYLEWDARTIGEAAALDVVTDREGAVYVLDALAVISKYDADGDRLAFSSVPMDADLEPVARLEIDIDMSLYGAATSKYGVSTGSLYRLTPTEKGFFDVAWQIETDGAPKDFRLSGNYVYVLEDVDPTEDGPQKAQVSVYLSGQTAALYLSSWSVPYPASALTTSASGAIYVTCPSNANRNKTVDGFTAHTDGWVPHEYANSEQRLWTWLDATVHGNPIQGAKAHVFQDRRFHVSETILSNNGEEPVLDDTKRPAANRKTDLGGQPNRPPPTYDESAMGTRPAFKFNGAAAQKGLILSEEETKAVEFQKEQIARGTQPKYTTHKQQALLKSATPPYWPFGPLDGPDFSSGQGLLTYGNADSSAKAAATDAWPKNRAMIPPANVGFVFGIIFRLDRNAAPGIVFQHKAQDLQFGILANTRIAGTPYVARGTGTEASMRTQIQPTTPGWISVFIQADTAASPTAYEFQYDTLFDGATDNEADVVLLTWTFDEPNSDDSFIRCNGEPIAHVASGSWPANEVRGEALGISSVGGYIKGYRGTCDMFNYGLSGFSGWVAETVTVLADSSGGVHNVAFNLTVGTTVNNGEAWGSVDPGNHPYGDGGGSAPEPNETEKLEGYLAHKWGVSHVLPNGDGGQDAASAWNDHAFGPDGGAPINTWSDLPDTEDANALALKSGNPILAKYGGILGELRWAFAGTGVGYQVAVDSDHDVIGAGEYVTAEERGLGSGFNQRAPVVRKIIDLGNTYKTNELRAGTLTFTVTPDDGDTFIVTLDGVPTTFYFLDSVSETYHIDRGGSPSVSEMAQRTNDAIYNTYLTVAPHGYWHTITADNVAGVVTLEVNLADLPESPGTISLTVTGVNPPAAVDFAGGVRVPESWVHWDTTASAPTAGTAGLRMVGDDGDDIWQPFRGDSSAQYQLYRWTEEGGAQHTGTPTGTPEGHGTTNGIALRRYRVGLPTAEFAQFHSGAGVALSPGVPNYGTDPAGGARYFYVATDLTDNTTLQETVSNLWKVEANIRTPINTVTTHREVFNILVSGGDGIRFTRDGSYTVPTGGTDMFDAASKWVTGQEMFGKIYLSDGTAKLVYDPDTDTFSDWKAETGGGSVPDNIKLLSSWRGKMVAVSHDDPFNIHFSKLGDALNWNEFPPEGASLEMAISFNNPLSLGESPDIVSAFIPLDHDKFALIGGDHTIQLLVNDPVAASIGSDSQPALVEVSSSEGIAFGADSWTKDPEGIAYFKGSKLGVYAYRGREMVRISENRIERDLDSINLEDYRVALAWAPREEGMYVLQLPTGAGGIAVKGWFWEKKTGAWSDVTFDDTTVQPTAVMVLDGDDPLDRRLCVGTEDGKVLYWDRDAANDDGTRIVSSVLLGPYEFSSPDREGRLVSLQTTLAADQHGAECEVYVSNQADTKGSPVWTGTLVAGFNRITVRARGSYVWIRYLNGTVGERWAHEHTVVRVAQAGRRKVGS